nr:MAG TPA: hypothetical protein [Caudoviricetes sp.]
MVVDYTEIWYNIITESRNTQKAACPLRRDKPSRRKKGGR